ncbi:hypothetical protein, partial [Accumulibacter sp.]|uniref:hypothetical protein n=1 Tax=Accumulibacter sp. TaxID=2053492 RepID=UPI002B82224A
MKSNEPSDDRPPSDPGEPRQVAPGAALAGQHGNALARRAVAVGADNSGDIDTGDRVLAAQPGARIVYAEKGATVVIGSDAPVPMTAVDRASALGRYLQHLISENRYLQLQGIRSRGKLVNIEL